LIVIVLVAEAWRQVCSWRVIDSAAGARARLAARRGPVGVMMARTRRARRVSLVRRRAVMMMGARRRRASSIIVVCRRRRATATAEVRIAVMRTRVVPRRRASARHGSAGRRNSVLSAARRVALARRSVELRRRRALMAMIVARRRRAAVAREWGAHAAVIGGRAFELWTLVAPVSAALAGRFRRMGMVGRLGIRHDASKLASKETLRPWNWSELMETIERFMK